MVRQFCTVATCVLNLINIFFKFYRKGLKRIGVHIDTKVSMVAKIRNRYNLVPHLTQTTNGKVTNSQLDTTNVSQEVSPFAGGDHKAHINRRTKRYKTEKNIKDPQKKYLEQSVKVFYWRRFHSANLTLHSDVDQDT